MAATFSDAPLVPTLDEYALPSMSDDQCVAQLVQAIEKHDDAKLDELALLIGRLAVPIEI